MEDVPVEPFSQNDILSLNDIQTIGRTIWCNVDIFVRLFADIFQTV